MKNIQQIIDEYKRLNSENIKNKMKVMMIIITTLTALMLVFFFVRNINITYLFLFVITLGLNLIAFLLVIIFKSALPTKPLYEYLYKEIVEDINYDNSNDYNISYTAFPVEKEFVKEGGIFTNGSTKKIRYKLEFNNSADSKVTIMDAYIYTQSNNSTIIHLDGTYIILEIDNSIIFQLRSNGRPKLKGTKYIKIQNDVKRLKEYIEVGTKEYIDSKYYSLFNAMKGNNIKKQVFISGIPNKFHLGISKDRMPKKVKLLDSRIYQDLKNQFLIQIETAEEYYKMIEY